MALLKYSFVIQSSVIEPADAQFVILKNLRHSTKNYLFSEAICLKKTC